MNKLVKYIYLLLFLSIISVDLKSVTHKNELRLPFVREVSTAVFLKDTGRLIYKHKNKIIFFNIKNKISNVLEFDNEIMYFKISYDYRYLEICFVDSQDSFSFGVYDRKENKFVYDVCLEHYAETEPVDFINSADLTNKVGKLESNTLIFLDMQHGHTNVVNLDKPISRFYFINSNTIKVIFQDGDSRDICIKYEKENSPFIHAFGDIMCSKQSPDAQYIGVLYLDQTFMICDREIKNILCEQSGISGFTFFNDLHDSKSYCLVYLENQTCVLIDIAKKEKLFGFFVKSKDKKYVAVIINNKTVYLFKNNEKKELIHTGSLHHSFNELKDELKSFLFITFLGQLHLFIDCENGSKKLVKVANNSERSLKGLIFSNYANYGCILDSAGKVSLFYKDTGKLLAINNSINRDIPAKSCKFFGKKYISIRFDGNFCILIDMHENEIYRVCRYFVDKERRFIVFMLSNQQVLLFDYKNEAFLHLFNKKVFGFGRKNSKNIIDFSFFEGENDVYEKKDYFVILYKDHSSEIFDLKEKKVAHRSSCYKVLDKKRRYIATQVKKGSKDIVALFDRVAKKIHFLDYNYSDSHFLSKDDDTYFVDLSVNFDFNATETQAQFRAIELKSMLDVKLDHFVESNKSGYVLATSSFYDISLLFNTNIFENKLIKVFKDRVTEPLFYNNNAITYLATKVNGESMKFSSADGFCSDIKNATVLGKRDRDYGNEDEYRNRECNEPKKRKMIINLGKM